jgi:hypothetical protein
MSNGSALEQVGSDLIEQRLEGVVVVLVDQHDLGIGLLERPRSSDSRKTSPENEYARRHQPTSTLDRCGEGSITQPG